MRRTSNIENLVRDLQYACRTLVKAPTFTLAAISTLTLGIGANTAIFQLLDAVRLRSLPVPEPHRLAQIEIPEKGGFGISHYSDNLSYPLFQQIREHQQAFSGIFAWNSGYTSLRIGQGAEARRVPVLGVTGEFFAALRVSPAAGRLFRSDDDLRGLSCAHCGSELPVLAKRIRRKSLRHRLAFGRSGSSARSHWFVASRRVLRTRSRTTFRSRIAAMFYFGPQQRRHSSVRPARLFLAQCDGQAETRLDACTGHGTSSGNQPQPHAGYRAQRLFAPLPGTLSSVPLGSDLGCNGREPIARGIRPVTVAAPRPDGIGTPDCLREPFQSDARRAGAREREFAVRLALGAGRGRLIRQTLTEGLLLAAVGAAFGLALAAVLSRAILRFLETDGNQLNLDLTPDWRMLAFTAGVSSLACVLLSLAPAFRAARGQAAEAMKASARGLTADRSRFGFSAPAGRRPGLDIADAGRRRISVCLELQSARHNGPWLPRTGRLAGELRDGQTKSR